MKYVIILLFFIFGEGISFALEDGSNGSGQGNADIFFKEIKGEITVSEKLGNEAVDLEPQSKLYRVEGQDIYFFVEYNKFTYYTDQRREFYAIEPYKHCHILKDGYRAQIYFGRYPQLIAVRTLDSFYPMPSSIQGPFRIVNQKTFEMSTLNLVKSQWIDPSKFTHKIIHIKKEKNEEFFSKIQLVK